MVPMKIQLKLSFHFELLEQLGQQGTAGLSEGLPRRREHASARLLLLPRGAQVFISLSLEVSALFAEFLTRKSGLLWHPPVHL